jgi:hypothetical protein
MLMIGPNRTRMDRYLLASPSGGEMREVVFQVTHYFIHVRPHGNGRSCSNAIERLSTYVLALLPYRYRTCKPALRQEALA